MEKTLKQRFGARMAQLRRERGTSQEDFAALIGVSARQVSRIECGDSAPSFELLDTISRTLGVEPMELFRFRN